MAFEVTENDYRAMDQFHLNWRWTNLRWNKLPETALVTIKPLSEEKAEEINRYALHFATQTGLSSALYTQITEFDCKSDDSINSVRKWLLEKIAHCQESVYVSWDSKTSVITTPSIFAQYWDDFCYPMSDDVVTWPQSEKWAIFYHHEERLFYGE